MKYLIVMQLQIRIILMILNRIAYKLADLISFDKLKVALEKLTWYKSLELNPNLDLFYY